MDALGPTIAVLAANRGGWSTGSADKNRWVPLAEPAQQALAQHRREQNADRDLFGDDYDVLDELKKATAENATKLVPHRAIHTA